MSYSDIKLHLTDYRFAPDELDFRAGSYGAALVYVDIRAYQTILDEVAPEEWQEGQPVLLANTVVKDIALVSVVVPLIIAGRVEYGISDFKTPTAARAQAFKRACANHGLGAYLYDVPDLRNAFDGSKLAVSKSSLVATLFEHWGLDLPEGYRVEKAPARQQSSAPARQQSSPRSGGFTKGQRGKLHYAGLEDDEIDALDALGKTKEIMDMAFADADADEIRDTYLTPARSGGRARW